MHVNELLTIATEHGAFDQSIFSPFERGLVTYEEALRWASNADEFKLRVQGTATRANLARDEMARAAMSSGRPDLTRVGS